MIVQFRRAGRVQFLSTLINGLKGDGDTVLQVLEVFRRREGNPSHFQVVILWTICDIPKNTQKRCLHMSAPSSVHSISLWRKDLAWSRQVPPPSRAYILWGILIEILQEPNPNLQESQNLSDDNPPLEEEREENGEENEEYDDHNT